MSSIPQIGKSQPKKKVNTYSGKKDTFPLASVFRLDSQLNFDNAREK